jgi:hypothetical protein
MNDEIKKQLIMKLGLEDLDTEEQDVVFADIGEAITDQILLDAFDTLSPVNQSIFKELSSKEDLSELITHLEKNVTNYEQLVASASTKVMNDLLT